MLGVMRTGPQPTVGWAAQAAGGGRVSRETRALLVQDSQWTWPRAGLTQLPSRAVQTWHGPCTAPVVWPASPPVASPPDLKASHTTAEPGEPVCVVPVSGRACYHLRFGEGTPQASPANGQDLHCLPSMVLHIVRTRMSVK